MRLRPFFSFYGSKYRLARHYPPPSHARIIEPFAGGAGYSTYYSDHLVHLYEIDPKIYGVWHYLIHTTPSEINRLPIVTNIDEIDTTDSRAIPQEARWLIGLWFNRCTEYPRHQLSAWGRTTRHHHPLSFWSPETRARIASQVPHIRHWRVYNRSYETAPNLTSTWFIDPPYISTAGRCYRSGRPDYTHLGTWSRSRRGQVIVCEHNGADWLPFSRLCTVNACKGVGKTNQQSVECMWTNESSLFLG